MASAKSQPCLFEGTRLDLPISQANAGCGGLHTGPKNP